MSILCCRDEDVTCTDECLYVLVIRHLWMVIAVFFFQAEDGIRDLVRSRGLGDVYKRQRHARDSCPVDRTAGVGEPRDSRRRCRPWSLNPGAVSYTHLTLPTSDLV